MLSLLTTPSTPIIQRQRPKTINDHFENVGIEATEGVVQIKLPNAKGKSPTPTVAITVLVVRSITLTLSSLKFGTYAWLHCEYAALEISRREENRRIYYFLS